MLAQIVSPPTAGTSAARKIEPIGGSRSKVTSLCHAGHVRTLRRALANDDLGVALVSGPDRSTPWIWAPSAAAMGSTVIDV